MDQTTPIERHKKNFSELLKENVHKGPSHLDKLLRHSPSSNINSEFETRVTKLEGLQAGQLQESLKSLSGLPDRINRIEGLLEAILLNNQELGKNLLQAPKARKNPFKLLLEKYGIRKVAAIGVVVLLLTIMIWPRQEQVVVQKEIVKDYVVTTGRVNLRLGPGTEFDKLTQVTANQKLELIKIKDEWFHIVFRDHLHQKSLDGWIHRDYAQKLVTPQKTIQSPK